MKIITDCDLGQEQRVFRESMSYLTNNSLDKIDDSVVITIMGMGPLNLKILVKRNPKSYTFKQI